MTIPLETADIETSSDAYATRFSGSVGSWFLDEQLRIVQSQLGTDTSLRILDVGGGHGQLANPLALEGFSVTVIGSDPICQKRLLPNVEFVTGNLVALPFPDQSFDVVLCFRFLSHCQTWEVCLQELTRVAKQCVIIEYPVWISINSLTPFLFSWKKKVEKNTRSYRLFWESEVLAVLQRNGFAIKERQGQYVLPMVLHRFLKKPTISRWIERMLHVLFGRLASPVIARWYRDNKGSSVN